jgi:hypothetical protein
VIKFPALPIAVKVETICELLSLKYTELPASILISLKVLFP